MSQARGRVIPLQDSEGNSGPHRFASQVEVLTSDPDICLVSGPMEVFDGDTGVATRVHYPRSWQPRLEWDLLFANAGGTSANVTFPRIFRGSAILYPARLRYAEDYDLWCRLSRLGRVVSLPDIHYRYREHRHWITGRSRQHQEECAARIRHANVSSYLDGDVSAAAVSEVLRFWNRDATSPFAESARRITGLLGELRSTFLAYVEERYGPDDRAVLENEIEQAFAERLTFWMCRSLRFLDADEGRGRFSI